MKLLADSTIFDKEAYFRPDHIFDEEDFDRANEHLSRIFSLYTGYSQISL
jgi:hypothetical protein